MTPCDLCGPPQPRPRGLCELCNAVPIVRTAWRSGIENLLAEAKRVATQTETGGSHVTASLALANNETLDGGAASGGRLDDCAGIPVENT